MAKSLGQKKEDVIESARKTPAEPNKPVETEGEDNASYDPKDDPYLQSSIDAGSLDEEMSMEQAGDYLSSLSMFPDEAKQDSPDPIKALDTSLKESYVDLGMQALGTVDRASKRRGIASGLKDLSKRGALTGDLLRQARQRAADAGVTEEQFDTFLEKSRIRERGSPFAFKKPKKGTGLFDQPAPDPTAAAAAAQNVMFQRQFGTGLGTLAAMQDPNYELGSGSALRQPARPIGSESGKYRRASRRLRRQGYGGAAQQMAMAGEMARMREPSIVTPAYRRQQALQRIEAGREAQKQDKIMAGMVGDMGATGAKGKAGVIKGARESVVDQRNAEFDARRDQMKKESEERSNAQKKKTPSLIKYDLRDEFYYDEDGNKKILNPFQTMEFRDYNGNGIEDRAEGLYLPKDFITPPKNYGKHIAV